MESSKIRLCVFGTSILNEYISQNHKKNKIEYMCIITHNDDRRDIKLLSKYRLFPLKKNIKCKVYYFSKYNEKEILKILKKENINIGISIGCRFIFKKKIINYFKQNLFNIHDSFLPLYKGGAPISYSIMNREKFIGATFHKINKKIDDGDIIYQKKIKIKESSKPVDAMKVYYNFLKTKIFKFIKSNKLLSKKKSNKGFYFPRLNAEKNGLVDVNWETKNCISFINSFSDPYPGAYTIYKGKKIIIKDASIYSNKKYHPFLNGKIVYIGNNYLRTIMGGKIVELKNLFLKNKKKIDLNKYFRKGENFYSTENELFKSKSFRKKYF